MKKISIVLFPLLFSLNCLFPPQLSTDITEEKANEVLKAFTMTRIYNHLRSEDPPPLNKPLLDSICIEREINPVAFRESLKKNRPEIYKNLFGNE